MFGCALCKKNGETEEFYRSHKLRDENNKVTCPVLKEFTCPLCHVKGDHTSSYCPVAAKDRTEPKKSPVNRKEESRSKPHRKTPPRLTTNNSQQLCPQFRRQQLITLPTPQIPKIKPAPSLPDARVGSAENLEKLLNAANKMHILQRLAYLQFHGYSWDRFLALQTIINHSFIVI